MCKPAMFSACAIALIAATTSSASAQLVFGTTTPTTSNGSAFYLDVTSGTVTTLWNSAANKKVNGLAADPVSGRLYANDAARLNYWNYGSVGTAPTFIAGMYRTNDNITFAATGVNDLAFANGNLYGNTSFASSTFNRGIYKIATVSDGAATPHCVMTPLWTTTNTSTVLGGLEYNPADNLFYVTSTVDVTGSGGLFGLGVYSIDAFGTGAVTKITDFPAGRTKIDGMAIGGGKYWITEQDPTNNRIDIYPYDPVTATYGTTIFVPLTDSTQRASGAAWAPGALSSIPAPTAFAPLALAGLLAARRKR